MKYGSFREKDYSNCEVARETRRNPRLFQRSQETQRKQTKRSVRLLHAENVSSWKKLPIRNAPTPEISKLLTTFVTWKISAANSRVYAVVETEAKDVSPTLLERYKQTSLGFHSSGLGLGIQNHLNEQTRSFSNEFDKYLRTKFFFVRKSQDTFYR